MSDVAQGPGWWMASDGKWYEPKPPPPRPIGTESSRAAPKAEYCSSCGAAMESGGHTCAACGIPRLAGKEYCWNCASKLELDQTFCTNCGAGLHGAAGRGSEAGTVQSKRVIAAALSFFLGAFGAGKFYLGYKSTGLLRLGIAIIGGVLTLGLATAAMAVIGMIEAVIYYTKSDADFIRIYQQGTKTWF
jgi:TM2 domain-containing membrane protein YozV